MLARHSYLLAFLIAAACAEAESDHSVDAAVRDGGSNEAGVRDGGRTDAGARDAAARCIQPSPNGRNPPECPCGGPSNSNGPCTQPTSLICMYGGDCKHGAGIDGVTWTAQCVEGTWRTQWPDFCSERRDAALALARRMLAKRPAAQLMAAVAASLSA